MRIVVISDTHCDHEVLGRLEGDVLIHCGDIGLGHSPRFEDFARIDAWFGRQWFDRIFCIGGNHDFLLEGVEQTGHFEFRHAEYLVDRRCEHDGVRFFGAPWVPELQDWAHYQDGAGLQEKWLGIPVDTDVLITHTPPFGILDRNSVGKHCGCRALRARVTGLSLRLHCFGHVHASAGIMVEAGTTYVNASMVDRSWRVVRRPWIFDL